MRRLLLAMVLAVAMLVPAASASAFTGEFARFNTCPLSNPEVTSCLYAETNAGSFTIGQKAVPIKNTVVLKGGLLSPPAGSNVSPLIAPTDGIALSKTPQPVPGGLLGVTAPTWWPQLLRDLFNETINNGFTGVTSTLELAGPPSAVQVSLLAALTGNGTAISMPVKVKLSNPFLGNNCYIGSNSNPIKLNLTAGTTSPPPPNQPITGSTGLPELVQEGLIGVTNNRLVDNAFAAPGANGCGGILFSWAVDPFVNSIVGVPSAAGTNTAILGGTTYLGSAPALREMQ